MPVSREFNKTHVQGVTEEEVSKAIERLFARQEYNIGLLRRRIAKLEEELEDARKSNKPV